jgi:hypothetical protein
MPAASVPFFQVHCKRHRDEPISEKRGLHGLSVLLASRMALLRLKHKS